MSRVVGIGGVVAVLVFVLLFSRWNGAERVTVDLGIWTLYRVPVIYVAFISLLLGMMVMLLAGLHSDLKIRRFLRDRLEEESRDEGEYADRNQRDLFEEAEIPSWGSSGDRGGSVSGAAGSSSPPLLRSPVREPREDESGPSPP